MNRDELLAKIRKCLSLAKSANEHEAAAALAKARKLIDDNGFDHADIAAIDVGEARAKGSGAWTPARWENYLVAAIKRAIPVESISVGDEGWSFVGLTPAPEIASYAFIALYRQLKRARSMYIATVLRRVKTAHRKTVRADAFCEGWALAVHRAIAALYPARDTDPIVKGWIERRYPNLTSFKPRATNAGAQGENDRLRGHVAGREVSLNQGVSGQTQMMLGLLDG